ncbi:MAG: DNA internalization-related competence protein ComEC/Rec2 [Chloroflexi bacterium]|nr:DNA internalization-related competence protein ComEC/Rec2 [Chloroflexota bacterium]
MPAALAGVAFGILAADFGVAVSPLAAAVATVAGCLLAVAGGRAAAAALLGAMLVGGMALGAWRHVPASASPVGTVSVASLVDGAEHDIAGTVVDDPRPRADRIQLVLGDLATVRGGRAVTVVDRLLVWLPRGMDVRSGARLALRGRVELAEDFDGFAYREYLSRQGIGGIARARHAEIAAAPQGAGALLATLRSTLLGGITAVVPEPEAALGAGILLGVRSSIAPEVSDDFATAGLTHVVAISGWNIAIVVALVGAMLRPLERRPGGRWLTAAVATLSVAGYVVLTGASPSVMRAALMAGALLVGRFAGSRAHAASALGLAALVMLVAAPAVLWDVGFQLSLLATAGLIWFGRPIGSRLERWPSWIREPVALTLAAQLTTLPVVLVNFERVSMVAPLANVLVVPIVPLVMLFTAVAAVLGVVAEAAGASPIGDALSWLAGGPAWLLLRAMIGVGAVAAAVPGAAIEVKVPPPLAAAWLPVLGLAWWALREDEPADRRTVPDEAMSGALAGLAAVLRPRVAFAAMLALLLAITLASQPDGQLHVTVLDVGQGDAILVETPGGSTVLVDGGPDPELTLRRLGANLPFFARRIDLIMLSHPHQDHVAGLIEVLDRFRVGAVLHAGIPFENTAYTRLLTDAARAGIPVHLARAGHRVTADRETTLEILYPTAADAAAPLPDGDINNGSVVAVLRHRGFAALLTGDAEAPIEAALVARGVLPPVDLLKVGHHGSHSSTTPALLEAIRPAIAVISAGEDNEHGHPAAETLATLASRPGIIVLRTDLHGDVEIVSDGVTLRGRTDLGEFGARPVHGAAHAGSIGPWSFPIAPPHAACSTAPGCRTASWSTPRASPGLPPRPHAWSPKPGSRSTSIWWRLRPSSTTSTSSRSGAPAASTGSWGRAGSRRRDTTSSRCRSPRTRSRACSTTSGSRSAGRRCSSRSRTATWRRSS